MNLLEQAQERLKSALLAVQGQPIVIKRGSGQSQTTVYDGLAIVAPLLDDSSLDGGYRAGFDACSVTLPSSVVVKRGDAVELSDGSGWKIAPGDHAIHKCDGFGQLQKITMIRSTNGQPNSNGN